MHRLLPARSLPLLFVLLILGAAATATPRVPVAPPMWLTPPLRSSAPLRPAGGDPVVTGVSLPRMFVFNEGQWDARVRAASFGPGSTISVGREGYRIAVRNGIAARE
ncbi:MAG: hypothetical protein RBU27_13690, partial [Bacteroidota bacterium]|nr:hypothetical protein [Bacteroidota bacterium]